MTKVQIHFVLTGALDNTIMESIAVAHSFYGILRVQVTPSRDGLIVDYDASRLTEADIEATLRRGGIPVKQRD